MRRKLTKQSAVFAFVEFSFVIKKINCRGVIGVVFFANNLVLIYTGVKEKTTSNLVELDIIDDIYRLDGCFSRVLNCRNRTCLVRYVSFLTYLVRFVPCSNTKYSGTFY